MIYNVNIVLENQIKNARTEDALKDAVLNLASPIVSDMQRIDVRRENGDDELRGAHFTSRLNTGRFASA